MKSNLAFLAYAMAWIATAAAVGIADCVTKDATPLWAMFFPCFVSSLGFERW